MNIKKRCCCIEVGITDLMKKISRFCNILSDRVFVFAHASRRCAQIGTVLKESASTVAMKYASLMKGELSQKQTYWNHRSETQNFLNPYVLSLCHQTIFFCLA